MNIILWIVIPIVSLIFLSVLIFFMVISIAVHKKNLVLAGKNALVWVHPDHTDDNLTHVEAKCIEKNDGKFRYVDIEIKKGPWWKPFSSKKEKKYTDVNVKNDDIGGNWDYKPGIGIIGWFTFEKSLRWVKEEKREAGENTEQEYDLVVFDPDEESIGDRTLASKLGNDVDFSCSEFLFANRAERWLKYGAIGSSVLVAVAAILGLSFMAPFISG